MRSMDTLIETLGFSTAKSHLSELMTSVVHDYQLKAVHRRKEEMFLVPGAVMAALVENFRFNPQVSVAPGEFVVRLPELNVIGAGETLDEAIDDLLDVASEFAEQYLDRLRYYAESEQLARFPWVARIAFTSEDARRALFEEDQGPHRPPVAA